MKCIRGRVYHGIAWDEFVKLEKERINSNRWCIPYYECFKCHKCGTNLQWGWVYCPYCGVKLYPNKCPCCNK